MHIVILDDYQDCVRTLASFSSLQAHRVSVYREPAADMQGLLARLATAQAVVLTRERTAMPAQVLERLPLLRVISTAGALPGNLDLPACTERGIAVAQSRGTGAPTAELCWALILASRRRLLSQAQSLREGRWQSELGQGLQGQRLGIWGYGRVGQQVARFGQAFGMRVWAWGRDGTRERALRDGVAVAASRAEFIAQSDVLSLHLSLSAETAGSISANELITMKPDALLVNTARAQLLQPGALQRVLDAGRPGHLALDVFEQEPVLSAAPAWLHHPRVLATPHIGFVERDNYEAYFSQAFEHILRFFQGHRAHLVNPEVVARS